MEIASYNKHHSAPFLRALVDHRRQVYSVEGSRRRHPINIDPAAIYSRGLPLGGSHMSPASPQSTLEQNKRLIFRWFDEIWNQRRRATIAELNSTERVLHDGPRA